MKIIFSRSLAVLLFLFPLLLPAAAKAADNVLTNPGFEDGIAPWTTDAGWALDTGVSHTGSNSYRCASGTSSRSVTLTPGGSFTLTGWARTSGISSSTRAAYIGVEWYTGSTWAGGVYASIYGSATDDWQQFEPHRFTIPAGTTRAYMIIAKYNGVSGTVWFDDLELNSPVSLYSQLRHPPYHETLFSSLEKRLNIGVKATGNTTYPIEDCSIVIDVENQLHESLLHANETYETSLGWPNYDYSLPSLTPGSYTVTTKLIYTPGSTEIAVDSHTLVVDGAETPRPKVYLDEHNRLIVDGEPFFPLGMYTSTNLTTACQQMGLLKAAKMNVQLWTGSNTAAPEAGAAYLQAAEQRGIKVLYNLARCLDGDVYYPGFTPPSSFGSWSGTFGVLQGIVSTFKDYPALLCWYINDEQEGEDVFAQLQRNYDFIRSTDTHPVVQVLVGHQDLQSAAGCTDVLGTDYYPVYGGTYDYDHWGSDVDNAERVVMGTKGVWSVIETPAIDSGQSRTATYDEILAQSYDAIIHGARGLLYFFMNGIVSHANSDELWQTMSNVTVHMDGLKDVALGMDAPADKTLAVSNSSVSVLTRVLENGDIYAMAVNPFSSSANATFTIGSGIAVSSYVAVGLPGATQRYITVTGMSFSDTLESLGTRVYCLYSSSGTGGTVTIYPGETRKPLAYPSVVTPNHDGKNDYLQIRYTCNADEKMTLKLFDLSGILVYERTMEGERFLGNNEYLAAWDCRDLSGSVVPQGLYLVTLFKGDKTYFKRLVQVLR